MKKLFFAFVATSVVVLSACNNKPAEATDATPVDTTVAAAVVATDSVAAVVATDSVAAPATK